MTDDSLSAHDRTGRDVRPRRRHARAQRGARRPAPVARAPDPHRVPACSWSIRTTTIASTETLARHPGLDTVAAQLGSGPLSRAQRRPAAPGGRRRRLPRRRLRLPRRPARGGRARARAAGPIWTASAVRPRTRREGRRAAGPRVAARIELDTLWNRANSHTIFLRRELVERLEGFDEGARSRGRNAVALG